MECRWKLSLSRWDLDKVEKLGAVIQILRQIITSGTVIKCPALFRSRKRVARLAFLADHHGILSGIGGEGDCLIRVVVG